MLKSIKSDNDPSPTYELVPIANFDPYLTHKEPDAPLSSEQFRILMDNLASSDASDTEDLRTRRTQDVSKLQRALKEKTEKLEQAYKKIADLEQLLVDSQPSHNQTEKDEACKTSVSHITHATFAASQKKMHFSWTTKTSSFTTSSSSIRSTPSSTASDDILCCLPSPPPLNTSPITTSSSAFSTHYDPPKRRYSLS